MWIKKKLLLVLLILLLPWNLCFATCIGQSTRADTVAKVPKCKKRKLHYTSVDYLGELIFDAVDLNWQLLSLDSVKILTAFMPVYIITRMVDDPVQINFYDSSCHRNINQFPKACHNIAQYGVAVPMVALSSLALFAPDEDLRLTGRMFAIALPFVHSGKDIIKKLEFKSCLRPWHQDFGRESRSTGGFPSGHMANVVFMATLFGMRHGPKWGIPLGLFASFVFADFLNCNRHYLSQLVAGSALGLLFAFAANKVIDKKLTQRCCVGLAPGVNGGTALQLSYNF